MALSASQQSASLILAILEECDAIDGHPFRSTGVLIQDLAKHGLVTVNDGWVVTTEKGKSAIRTLRAAIKEAPRPGAFAD